MVHAPVHDYAKRRFLWKLLCSSWCLVCKEGTASVTCTGRFRKPFLSKCNVHRSFPLLQCQYGIISSTCRRLPYRTGIKPYRNLFQIFPFLREQSEWIYFSHYYFIHLFTWTIHYNPLPMTKTNIMLSVLVPMFLFTLLISFLSHRKHGKWLRALI